MKYAPAASCFAEAHAFFFFLFTQLIVKKGNLTFLSFFFFFCGRSAVLRPSVHMLPRIGCCGAGLPLFPTTCWWLTHPAAITGVSVSTGWDSPGGCGGPSVPLLCNCRVQSPWCEEFMKDSSNIGFGVYAYEPISFKAGMMMVLNSLVWY